MQKELPTLRTITRAEGTVVQAMIFEVLREYNLAPDPADTDADLADLQQFYRSGWFAVLEWEEQIVGSVGLLPVAEGVLELRKMYSAPRLPRPRLGPTAARTRPAGSLSPWYPQNYPRHGDRPRGSHRVV